jgi:hypothetical protein
MRHLAIQRWRPVHELVWRLVTFREAAGNRSTVKLFRSLDRRPRMLDLAVVFGHAVILHDVEHEAFATSGVAPRVGSRYRL